MCGTYLAQDEGVRNLSYPASLFFDRRRFQYSANSVDEIKSGSITLMWLPLQVYFILELAELSKLNKQQGGDMYKRERKATLELANAVGRRTQGSASGSLNKGCLVRLQQLADKGYLAVKRPKRDRKHVKPAPYQGWQGWPRYGPRSSTPLPPPLPQLLPPQHPQQVVAATAAAMPDQQPLAISRQSSSLATPFGTPATAAVSAHFPAGLQPTLVPSSAAKLSQITAAGLPLVTNPLPVTTMSNPMPQTAVAAAAAPAAATSLLTPPSIPATASLPPSNGHSHQLQQQQQQEPLSDTTAVLVAAVGPLFESFVAQTAALVADPSMSLETLAGTITQELAAAIANAAVQAVGKKRQQLLPAPDTSLVNVSQPEVTAEAPLLAALTPAPLVTSSPAAAVAGHPSHMPRHSGPISNAMNAKIVSGPDVFKYASDKGDTRPGRMDTCKGGKNDGKFEAAVLASSTDRSKDRGKGRDVPANTEVACATAEAQAKRVSSPSEAEHTSKTKRQKIAASSQPLGMESEKHAVPSIDTSKCDTSASGKAQTGGRSKSFNDAQKNKGRKGSRKSSPGSRSSQGSGRSSPKGSASWPAAYQGHSQWVASPQSLGRHNSGSPYQPGPLGLAPAAVPSRLSSSFGPGSPMMSGSPMMNHAGPLQFPPDAFGQSVGNPGFGMMNAYAGRLSSPRDQAGMANGFVPLLPSSPAEWHMQPPALNNFPMAAHFLPGVDEAPDFSPVD